MGKLSLHFTFNWLSVSSKSWRSPDSLRSCKQPIFFFRLSQCLMNFSWIDLGYLMKRSWKWPWGLKNIGIRQSKEMKLNWYPWPVFYRWRFHRLLSMSFKLKHAWYVSQGGQNSHGIFQEILAWIALCVSTIENLKTSQKRPVILLQRKREDNIDFSHSHSSHYIALSKFSHPSIDFLILNLGSVIH